MTRPPTIVVTGGRHYADAETVARVLGRLLAERGIAKLHHGGCTGADALAARWAHANGVPTRAWPADWRRGGSGGPIRNRAMLDGAKPDGVVAFPGNDGTADCIEAAEERGIPVWRIR